VGAMSEDGKFRVEKFNSQNYQLWKMQMEDYLYQKDLFLPLSGVAKKPAAMKDEEWEILDRKALGTIWLSLAVSVAFNILKEKTTKDLMDALAKLYEKPSESNKVFLMKRLFNMKMSEGGSVVDHLNEFNTVTNQLSSVKVDFDDEVRALLILCLLGPHNVPFCPYFLPLLYPSSLVFRLIISLHLIIPRYTTSFLITICLICFA
jgi:hypothetical protein